MDEIHVHGTPTVPCLSFNKPLIIAGSTGVGKTTFAVGFARRFGGEIIGVDAYQVYAGMEVLTAQPERELLADVPHHLIGILSPSEPFDAAHFAELAHEKMDEIAARGVRPILVGGAGLYLKALTHGLLDAPKPDPVLRAELSALDAEDLRRKLLSVDPQAPEKIDFQNPRRVQRALEICLQTGLSVAAQREQWSAPPRFAFDGFLLTRSSSEMEERISANVREMFDRGVVEEVVGLKELGVTARHAIGLRHIQAYARDEMSLETCKATILKETRQYAKRQLTWFRNQFNFQHIDLTGLPSMPETTFYTEKLRLGAC